LVFQIPNRPTKYFLHIHFHTKFSQWADVSELAYDKWILYRVGAPPFLTFEIRLRIRASQVTAVSLRVRG